MTDKDRRDIKEIVTEVVTGLRELIEEKLNGHGATVERHGAQINQLYDLDRARVSDVSLLNKEVVRLDGRIAPELDVLLAGVAGVAVSARIEVTAVGDSG